MSLEGVKKAHTEGLLALYKIWRVGRLDKTTVVSTFQLPEEVVVGAFDSCVTEGYLEEAEAGCYDLTAAGEEKIESMMVRRGCIRVVMPNCERSSS